VDDPQTDEMAATELQRSKVSDLLLGAVKNSLSAEEPNAKLAMCITPQHPEDVSQQALVDSQWVSKVFPCWTKATIDLPVGQQESIWPELHPTDTLRADKVAAIQRNRLSIFTREMECRLISSETAAFKPNWLNIREQGICPPVGIPAVLAIDPVPPPSEQQKGQRSEGEGL
jgi:hypothetical protein